MIKCALQVQVYTYESQDIKMKTTKHRNYKNYN